MNLPRKRSRLAVFVWALVGSLLLHAIVGLVIRFIPTALVAPIPSRDASIEIVASEPVSTPRSGGASAGDGIKRRSESQSESQPKSIAKNLSAGVQFKPDFSKPMIEGDGIDAVAVPGRDPMLAVGKAAQGWSPAVQFMNAMDLVNTNENLGFYQALHRKVNAALVYPDDIARQRITGRIRVEAEVAKDGRLIRLLSTTADDRILQTYCLVLVSQLLQQPLPERAWLKEERAIVAFDFDFMTRTELQTPKELANGYQKNRLYFERESEIDSRMKEAINEIFTHYVPPIIPIPGGFYIEFTLAYQYVRNLIEGGPTEREKRQVRVDELHELLRTTLRRRASPSPSPTPRVSS